MRMTLPGVRERKTIDRQLSGFFREHREPEFRRAVRLLSRFYHLRAPKVEWFEYLDWGRSAGRCYDDGNIHLVHPENWKRGRKYKSERKWIQAVYHEMGHYVFWADAERKADTFAFRFVRGVSSGAQRRTTRVASPALKQSRLHRRPRQSRSH